MEKLFYDLCDIVFTLGDGTQILCKSTLNSEILRKAGYDTTDGFVDFMSKRLIPEELFSRPFQVLAEDTARLSELDSMFISGGKVAWQLLS